MAYQLDLVGSAGCEIVYLLDLVFVVEIKQVVRVDSDAFERPLDTFPCLLAILETFDWDLLELTDYGREDLVHHGEEIWRAGHYQHKTRRIHEGVPKFLKVHPAGS